LNERLSYIDQAKGFAIILMVFAHTLVGQGPINTWIFAFHMPIFFIICGILISLKNQGSPLAASKKRIRQLGIPYIVFCLLLVLFYWGTNTIAGSTYDLGGNIFKIISLQGIDSLWFLPCYFVSELALRYTILLPKFKVVLVTAIIAIILIASFLNSAMPTPWLYRLAIKFAICYSFVGIGYLLSNRTRSMHWGVAFVLLLLGTAISAVNGFSAIGSLELGCAPLYYLGAICISVALLSFFDKINIRLLSFYGINSIVLLCTNNLIIEIVRLLDYRIAGNFLLNHHLPGAILFTSMILLIEIPIIYLSNHQLHSIFGKQGVR